MTERRQSLLALMLLVPAPSIGAWLGLHVWPGAVGSAIWSVSKCWLAALPIIWWRFVDQQPLRFPKPTARGLRVALITGLAIATVILVGPHCVPEGSLDPTSLRETAEKIGFATPLKYLSIGLYICTVNAVLEEYVWRWFTFIKCESVFGRRSAVLGSALFFTLHHVIVLASVMIYVHFM